MRFMNSSLYLVIEPNHDFRMWNPHKMCLTAINDIFALPPQNRLNDFKWLDTRKMTLKKKTLFTIHLY